MNEKSSEDRWNTDYIIKFEKQCPQSAKKMKDEIDNYVRYVLSKVR